MARWQTWWMDEEVWTNSLGRDILIADMDPEYARAIKNMLLRKAQHYVNRQAWRMVFVTAAHDGGEMAHDSLEQITDELMEAARTPKGSVDVVKRWPLFKAVKRQSRRKAVKAHA